MIAIELTRGTVVAGDVVEGHVVFDGSGRGDTTVELSVLWETSGKGDTDIGVLHFERLANDVGRRQFRVQLPLLPLSYDGTIVKIAWLVRVRGAGGVIDTPFEVVSRA